MRLQEEGGHRCEKLMVCEDYALRENTYYSRIERFHRFHRLPILVVPSPLASSSAVARWASRLTTEDEVPGLEGVEFWGPRFYAEALGNDTPTPPSAGLVYFYDFFVRVSRHVTELEAHEGVGGRGHRPYDRLDLRQRNTELSAHFDGKSIHIGPGLDVEVVKETIQASTGGHRAAEENEHYQYEHGFLHRNPLSQKSPLHCTI